MSLMNSSRKCDRKFKTINSNHLLLLEVVLYGDEERKDFSISQPVIMVVVIIRLWSRSSWLLGMLRRIECNLRVPICSLCGGFSRALLVRIAGYY